MLEPDQADRLRARLLAADYTIDAVLDRIGAAGQAGLQRNSTIAAEVALAGADDPQATLIRLWLLQGEVTLAAATRALDVEALVASGVLDPDADRVRAAIDIRPYGLTDDDNQTGADNHSDNAWIVSDLAPGMNTLTAPTRPDYVLGVSPASTSLAQMTARTPIGSALDLGTGCGVQALHLARHARRVVGTDLNPRALELAALTTSLNQARVDLRLGSLYEPVADDRFDLIVTNPPYVMSPPTADADRLVYREGTFTGDGLVESIVRHAPSHLNPGGMLQVLGNWAILRGQPWQERITSWAADSGCDLWVVERERLDIFDYIEVWLTDAGLAGSPRWRPRYREWLDYFDALGVEAVGMGWIALTNAGRDEPDVEIESWPHAIEQPVGPAFAGRQASIDASLLSDADILARRWCLDQHVSEETIGLPGAPDPQHVVLRSSAELRRAHEVSTLAGGVLGACDGDLQLGVIVEAVAHLLDLDAVAATPEALPLVRRLLREGLLGSPRL